MMPVVRINLILYKTEADKTEWGLGKREGEREREERIKGAREGA